MNSIDTRGLSCPQPVVMVTKEIISGSKSFEVLVDSECSYENVTRLLENKKYKFETEDKIDHKVIKASK